MNTLKISAELFQIYEKYLDCKKKLLNNPKMLEYLFYRPIHKIDNLADIDKKTSDDYFNPTIVSEDQKKIIQELLFHMRCKMLEYISNYEIYKTEISKKSLKDAPITVNFTSSIDKIGCILHDLEIDFVYNWTFKQREEYLNPYDVKPYNFETDTPVDYYGCYFSQNKKTYNMYQFAIIYDSKSKRLTINDYLEQYYLKKMNVHLLRLVNGSDFNAEIKYFFKKILNGKHYVIRNALGIDFKKDISNKLEKFYQDYDYNKVIYLKYYRKHEEDICDSDENPVKVSKKPADESYSVTDNDIKKLIGKKYFFTK